MRCMLYSQAAPRKDRVLLPSTVAALSVYRVLNGLFSDIGVTTNYLRPSYN